MKILLQLVHEGQIIRSHDLDNGTYLVGCDRASVDIPAIFPTISRRHGKISITSTGVTYRDLASRNGSFIGGRACTRETDINWDTGTVITIGPFQLTWRQFDETPIPYSSAKAQAARSYSSALVQSEDEARSRLSASLRDYPDDIKNTVMEGVLSEFHADGPIAAYLTNPACREILINRFDEVFVDFGEGLRRADNHFMTAESFEAWAGRTAAKAGRRLDQRHPICEATLPNGARFHAMLGPLSMRGLSVAIRRFGSAPMSDENAIVSGWLSTEALATLREAVRTKQNIVISGGTSTGKTSLLNFLCRYCDPKERIITIEDTIELLPPVENLVQLQARTANVEGVGEITLRELLQSALRMRPDRIIVGECRGGEVLDMLQALNTGHPGSLTTVHANSPTEALQRLELLALLGAPNLSLECIREWIRATIHLIVQVERTPEGQRRVLEIVVNKQNRYERLYRCE